MGGFFRFFLLSVSDVVVVAVAVVFLLVPFVFFAAAEDFSFVFLETILETAFFDFSSVSVPFFFATADLDLDFPPPSDVIASRLMIKKFCAPMVFRKSLWNMLPLFFPLGILVQPCLASCRENVLKLRSTVSYVSVVRSNDPEENDNFQKQNL